MTNGIVMFSGGLDSACATHLLLSQGLSLKAVHFVLPFYAGLGLDFVPVRKAAHQLGVPLQIVEEGEEYLDVVKNPLFGFGKNANPCMDCRVHRLAKAKAIMEEESASFIVTGEVLGQRPMSQRKDCLHRIENSAGLKGYLVRPLSALLLPPTFAEKSGLIDRSRLLGISGRGRKEQLAYAQKHGLAHGPPAGGCILTNEKTAVRFKELACCNPGFSLIDFKLLAWGRHFRLSPSCRLVVGRDDGENRMMRKIVPASSCFLQLPDNVPGPLAVVLGKVGSAEIERAASLVSRYTRFKNEARCRVLVTCEGKAEIVEAVPAVDRECALFRI
ncbi:MAG: hypothetical protein JW768_16475 [Chitinispirillaceae bacterium]|nr:hypothetical protein [Chitinispirillaceae bacterium]